MSETQLSKGLYVDIEELEHGAWLHLTDAGRKELLDKVTITYQDIPGAHSWDDPRQEAVYEWKYSHAYTLACLLEDWSGNGWELCTEGNHAIGLTSAPILVYDPVFVEDGENEIHGLCCGGKCVYFFERYMIESELETLLKYGRVWFNKAK